MAGAERLPPKEGLRRAKSSKNSNSQRKSQWSSPWKKTANRREFLDVLVSAATAPKRKLPRTETTPARRQRKRRLRNPLTQPVKATKQRRSPRRCRLRHIILSKLWKWCKEYQVRSFYSHTQLTTYFIFSYVGFNYASQPLVFNPALLPDFASAQLVYPGVASMMPSFPPPGLIPAQTPFATPFVYYPYPIVNAMPTASVTHDPTMTMQQQMYWKSTNAASATAATKQTRPQQPSPHPSYLNPTTSHPTSHQTPKVPSLMDAFDDNSTTTNS